MRHQVERRRRPILSMVLCAAMVLAAFVLLQRVPTESRSRTHSALAPTRAGAPLVRLRVVPIAATAPSSGEQRDAAIDEEIAAARSGESGAAPEAPVTTTAPSEPAAIDQPVATQLVATQPVATQPVATQPAPTHDQDDHDQDVIAEPAMVELVPEPAVVVDEAVYAPVYAPVAEAAPVAAPLSGNHQSGNASWYDAAPGTCAHRTIPNGMTAHVTNTASGASTTCLVNGYGPVDTSRVIDLSRTTFSQIASTSQGIVPVVVEW